MTESMNRNAYRLYLDFLQTAEEKRCWNIFNDSRGEALEAAKSTEASAQCIGIFCTQAERPHQAFGYRSPRQLRALQPRPVA